MNKSRVVALKANKRILFWTKLLVEIKALNAIITLFYIQRGISVGEVLYLSVIWSVTALLLEIPSGYFADLFGRKKTIILGVLLHSLSISLMFVSFSFPMFALSIALASAGYACFTGTDSALLYDSLKEIGDEKSSLRVSGKYYSASRFSKIFIPLLGAILAKNLFAWQFNVLISIELIGALISLILANKLTEPNKHMDVSEKEEGMFKDSFKLFKENKLVRKFALNKSFVFIGILIIWRIYQPHLKSVGASIIVLGVIYAIFQLLAFLSLWLSDKIQKRITGYSFFSLPVFMGIISIFVFMFSQNIWFLSVATILLMILGTVRDPLFFQQINLHVKSFNRATTMSVLNVIKSIFDIPILLLVGYLADIDFKYVYLMVLSLFVYSLFFLRIEKKDIQLVDTK
ncbi:MFS transporter [Candidatus Microgenomates bacterium]|nr:MFS transporter [Candidatus Microgenomates bacterium]